MRYYDQIHFDMPPVMLAAWPGMGNVGLIAMDYLRKALGMQVFAELDMSPFLAPDSISVKDGIAQHPEMPTSLFFYRKEPNLIIFISNAQVSGRDGITVIKTILDVASQFQVKRLFTAAAFAQPMSYQTPSNVFAACSNESLLNLLMEFGATSMPDGYIAGLNGLVLGVAAPRHIEAACLLGTIPSYATALTYPKASLEIIRLIGNLFSCDIATEDLETVVAEMDTQLEAIEERIKEFFPTINEEHEGTDEIEEDKVPHYIMEKIEKLFGKVSADKTVATELKNELVRWNIYELYEKRFLDLFKESKDE